MANLDPVPDVDQAIAETARRQGDATDPTACVWVSANAGTGKTHVLTMRTLRLLLSGTPPERILCLTYTKAAASEMSTRVFDTLAGWVTARDDDLNEKLQKVLLRPVTVEEKLRARLLFARAIETPGGLKVQTIHAFCERLLQRFPLEAGIPPNFSILDDDQIRKLQREAIDAVLEAATRAPNSELGQALSQTIAQAADDRFDDILRETLRHRAWLAAPYNASGEAGGEDPSALIEARLRRALKIPCDRQLEDLDVEMSRVAARPTLEQLRDVLAGGGKTDVKNLAVVDTALNASSSAAFIDALARFFLTDKGEPRARLLSKKLCDANAGLHQKMTSVQKEFHTLFNQSKALRAIEATRALYTLADAIMQHYADAKARLAALDFEDLIAKADSLLAPTPGVDSGLAAWVLYKLDGGLDHILVDESQDTSPDQWRIISALATEFFSGLGAREDMRTVFAVGDKKQSIYSFQGAAPEHFDTMGAAFERMAKNAGLTWTRVPLDLSFRTVRPVLHFVDSVFADRQRTPGLSVDGDEIIHHTASRAGDSGLVEIWPTEKPDTIQSANAWQPLDEKSISTATGRLAQRITDKISQWLASKEPLLSAGRPIEPRDIMILVRKRHPFVRPMIGALKARKIPVSGADRMNLTQQIAVQDLMAVGDFATLPEDDLTLACVLKSPMFGLNDDDLFEIAYDRPGTLWKALRVARDQHKKFAFAAEHLMRWRARADFLPPFEFFAQILDIDGMRSRLMLKTGAEAADAIDEFLNLAIAFDERAPPSLCGFLAWLRSGSREIKRDLDQGANEVRVMTIHGAKGLEAPIVFLPDTCSTRTASSNEALIPVQLPHDGDGDGEPLLLWRIKGSGSLEDAKTARRDRQHSETAERNRLLYVAMTRARDRLYVCGFESSTGRDAGCWYDLMSDAVDDRFVELEDADGRRIRRFQTTQQSDLQIPTASVTPAVASHRALPAWAKKSARSEPQLSVPLAPSRLAPYDTDEAGDPAPKVAASDDKEITRPLTPDPPAGIAPGVASDERRFLRGTLTHALLEHLPTIQKDRWERVAINYIEKRGRQLNASTRASIVAETLAILNDADFAPLFGPRGRAEVSIAAMIPHPSGKGPSLRLSGQIDRLADVDGEILIIDYKTNRPPPDSLHRVSEAYLYQLAAYQLGLAKIYPKQRLRAAILWTQTAHLMEIPTSLLQDYAAKLWDL